MEITLTESEYQKRLNTPTQWEGKYAILNTIRQCESRQDYTVVNKRGSSASGAYQFLDGTWNNYAGYRRAKDAPAQIQDEKARLTFDTSGTRPWLASQSCWNPKPRTASNLTVKSSSTSVALANYPRCSCVLFAKAYSGKNPGSVGYAKNWPINSQTPQVGAVGITTESSSGRIYTGHVFVVQEVAGSQIKVIEANFGGCGISTRYLNADSPVIRGYFI